MRAIRHRKNRHKKHLAATGGRNYTAACPAQQRVQTRLSVRAVCDRLASVAARLSGRNPPTSVDSSPPRKPLMNANSRESKPQENSKSTARQSRQSRDRLLPPRRSSHSPASIPLPGRRVTNSIFAWFGLTHWIACKQVNRSNCHRSCSSP